MAKNLKELFELRGQAVAEARKLSETAEAAKRIMNEDEERQYNAHMDDEARFAKEIERETKLQEAEKRTLEITEDKALAFGKREFKPHLARNLVKISTKMLRADGMNTHYMCYYRRTDYPMRYDYRYIQLLYP